MRRWKGVIVMTKKEMGGYETGLFVKMVGKRTGLNNSGYNLT
jgi:hypothetical protein